MFDSHIHSNNSPDSRQTLDEICTRAIELGVRGITITDHAHMSPAHTRFFGDFSNEKNILGSAFDTLAAKEKYKDSLLVFTGIEIGEYLHDVEASKKILALADFDMIIGSSHFVAGARWDLAYSKIVFDESVSDSEIDEYLSLYFKELEDMTDALDFDVLAHLTCPLRYIAGRHKREVDITKFYSKIKDILNKIIEKNIALEVNTAGFSGDLGGKLDPDCDILKMYYDLGGRLLTIGSDAHRPINIALEFDKAKQILKAIGFEYYCYYEKRQPKKVKLN